jgi:hypothetical protein
MNQPETEQEPNYSIMNLLVYTTVILSTTYHGVEMLFSSRHGQFRTHIHEILVNTLLLGVETQLGLTDSVLLGRGP